MLRLEKELKSLYKEIPGNILEEKIQFSKPKIASDPIPLVKTIVGEYDTKDYVDIPVKPKQPIDFFKK